MAENRKLLERSLLEEITAIVPGHFPIDSWYPILLEVPDGGSKKHMGGRFPNLAGTSGNQVEWDSSRVINLPIYDENVKDYAPEALIRDKALNEFAESVPIITVATRYDGYYCDQSRAQSVSVLPVWADGTSMLLELDWYEGPLEDCNNPEWHIQASPRVLLKDGVDRLRFVCRRRPRWEDCLFYVYVIPVFLGSSLLGNGGENSSKVWQKRWKCANHGEILSALGKIVTTIMDSKIGMELGINETD